MKFGFQQVVVSEELWVNSDMIVFSGLTLYMLSFAEET